VFAAYLHRLENKDTPVPASKQFNLPAVLLTDASIFASGAAHIELGDGGRMLTNEYFPADTRLSISPALHDALRHYYDYLTAYENYLRQDTAPAEGIAVRIDGQPSDSLAVPDTIWTIARENAGYSVIHLINLRGTDDAHWRDISMIRPEPPIFEDLHVRISSPQSIRAVGWASPDVDGGSYHPVRFRVVPTPHGQEIELTLPSLCYWDTIFLTR
jgi:dextranase